MRMAYVMFGMVSFKQVHFFITDYYSKDVQNQIEFPVTQTECGALGFSR